VRTLKTPQAKFKQFPVMLNKPSISIVLPTFNRAKLLSQAIESVLAQRNVDFELIISDNCSEDNTQQVVSEYLHDSRVKYFRNSSNIGAIGNWRRGVFEHSTADWFLIMSDDDYFIDDGYLEKAWSLINANPRVGLIYAGGFLDDEEFGTRSTIKPPFRGVVSGKEVFVSRGTVKPMDCTLCNIVFNKQLAHELNFLSNENNVSADSELFLRICLLGDVGVIPEPVTVYRFHKGSITKRITTSARLLEGNVEHLVAPYADAKRLLSQTELETFANNTGVFKVISGTLLRLLVHKASSYDGALRNLTARLPDEVTAITTSPTFRLKKLAVSLARPWLRKRLQIAD
jgi:glycosyltransferase involved in cell wall biosynthesis